MVFFAGPDFNRGFESLFYILIQPGLGQASGFNVSEFRQDAPFQTVDQGLSAGWCELPGCFDFDIFNCKFYKGGGFNVVALALGIFWDNALLSQSLIPVGSCFFGAETPPKVFPFDFAGQLVFDIPSAVFFYRSSFVGIVKNEGVINQKK